MRSTTIFVWVCLLAAATLVACGPTQEDLDQQATQIAADIFGTQTAQAPTITNTPPPTATSTPEPTATPTFTPTDEPTSTPTDAPTLTPSPTETPVPTPTDTATATLIPSPTLSPPTRVPPTPVPQAHAYPSTPIQNFDVDVFLSYLGRVRDSFRSAQSELPQIFSGAKHGDCGSYIGWFALWIAEAPGFTDVPADWYPLYAEYRSLLKQAIESTWEIHTVCDSGGGEVSDETGEACLGFIEWAYPRSEEMVTEGLQMPRP